MRIIWDIVHFLGGLITALVITKVPALGVVMFVAFIFYELNEEKHIDDEAFLDIRAYLLGMFVVALNILGVIP